MPGSGELGLRMAAAFGVPHSVVGTAIKALRAGRVLSIKGRGSSAAQMTAADAAAIVVGIMSGAVSAEVPLITRRILEMPSRHFVRAPAPVASDLVRPRQHLFVDGFRALFDTGWDGAAAGADEMQGACVTVGLDGSRSEGFAVIETRDHDGAPMKNFYSTRVPNSSLSKEANPMGLGLELYPDPPPFVFSASVDGRGLAALRRALVDPASARRPQPGRRNARREAP